MSAALTLTAADVLTVMTPAELHPANGSKAMELAFAAMRLHGIKRARKMHDERHGLVQYFSQKPSFLNAYLNNGSPRALLTYDEAAAYWAEQVRELRVRRAQAVRTNSLRAPSNNSLRPRLNAAADRLIFSRFFRRYANRIWLREAA